MQSRMMTDDRNKVQGIPTLASALWHLDLLEISLTIQLLHRAGTKAQGREVVSSSPENRINSTHIASSKTIQRLSGQHSVQAFRKAFGQVNSTF